MLETDSPRYMLAVCLYTYVYSRQHACMNDRAAVLGMWYFSMSDMTVIVQEGKYGGKKPNRTETKSISKTR